MSNKENGKNANQVVTSDEPDTQSTHCCDKIFGSACCRCMEKVSDAIIGTLEKAFYHLGYTIGRFPWVFILGVFIFFLIFIPGVFVNFYEETDPTNLWTPLGIKARDDKAWVEEHYQSTARFNGLIVEADNVLTAAVIKQMYSMDKKIKAIEEGDTYSWDSLCAKLGPTCWSNSLLELWEFNESTINALTDSEVLTKVNTVTVSPVYYNNYTVENVLGDISRDGNGDITGAKATTMTYFLDVSDAFDVPEDDPVYDFELEFIEIAQEDRSGISVYIFSGRSFGDEAGGAILGDVNLLSAGYVIVIVFVCIAIGSFSCLYQKIYLTLGGILCIGLSIGFSMGLCAYASINWGPLHNVLPFLVLGIGVDDMFVIVQNWENLSPDTHSKPIPERIGLTMKHAGMSITVTSITDILAFAVGASTILPALRSFCIYAAMCIVACFMFQVLLFVACLTYDQRRAEASRNACCCCYVHRDHQPSKCSQRAFVVTFFEKVFAPFLVKLPVKIVVMVVALGVFAGGLYGTIKMEQFFDAKWFIPSNSYLTDYFDKSELYFKEGGLDVAVYTGNVNYFSKQSELESLYEDIVSNQYTQTGSVDSWFRSFTSWLSDNSANPNVAPLIDSDNYPSSSGNFNTLLNIFLYNDTSFVGDGTRFVRDLVFSNGELDATRITFRQPLQTGTTEQIASMDSIRTVCDDTDLGDGGTNCIVYSPEFLSFEGDKVIKEELFRNLGLAFLCVVLMTLLLLANLWGCLLVSVCVVMSLVDVVGFMHFWGLTIDTVSTINLIIAIGLTVDYSAHIAHTFMTEVGDRNERVISTLSYIGPAVFYGGFSTFLAFILLAASASYVFTTFFKIFLLVVVWGLFHGLMVLPVLLSWVGPPPYLSAVEHAKEGKHKRELGNGKINSSNEDLPMEFGSPPKYESMPGNGLANPAFKQEPSMDGSKANGAATPTQVNL